MSTSALAQRTQEKLMERIKTLRKLKDNRKCFECLSKSPSCVDTTHNTFVCMTCGGILRMFNFRVKSISISSFAVNEVEALEAGGNKVARKKWLAGFDGEYPTTGNTDQIKEFIRKKFEESAWVNKSTKSKRKNSNKAEPAEQEQSDDEESQIPSVSRRKSSGGGRAVAKPPSSAPPDLLDLNAIFSSQAAPPPAQAMNFAMQPSSVQQQQQQPAYQMTFAGGQARSDFGAFDNSSSFHGSFQQPTPQANFGQSFQMDPFFASPPQYSTPFSGAGMGSAPTAAMSPFPNMSAMQQPQMDYRFVAQQQQQLQQQQRPSQQQMSESSLYPQLSHQQPPQRVQPPPAPQANADPFADLLGPHALGTNAAPAAPAAASSMPANDMFSNGNATMNMQQSPKRNSLQSDNVFGNAAIPFASQPQSAQPPKRGSITSDNAFGNVAFGAPDAFDPSNPFGPAPTSAPDPMGVYGNRAGNSNYPMDPQSVNRTFGDAHPVQQPFYAQPTSPFGQSPMPFQQPQQQPQQPYGQAMPQSMPQQPQASFSSMQAFQQPFAARPVDQFPFNNMPAQSAVSAYNMQQAPGAVNNLSNVAVPDFFSKQRPVESRESDPNSNPFL